MTAITFDTPVEFHIEEMFTYGIENSKFGGYSVPIKFEPESELLTLLKDTAEKNGVSLKLYGSEKSTLYLKCDQLSGKQRADLFGTGRMIIDIEFSAVGTYVGKDGPRLKFEISRLRKVKAAEKVLRPAPRD